MQEEIKNRRPLRSRETGLAKWAAKKLQQKGATPNGISLVSMPCAAIAGVCFLFATQLTAPYSFFLFSLAIVGILGRLICNLLDGMVAIEGKMKSPVGAIYNEFPDRLSDMFIILGIGYSLTSIPSAVTLGWAASLAAVMTAYVRLLGGTCGLEQKFTGPMAKQQRMFVVIVGFCSHRYSAPAIYIKCP